MKVYYTGILHDAPLTRVQFEELMFALAHGAGDEANSISVYTEDKTPIEVPDLTPETMNKYFLLRNRAEQDRALQEQAWDEGHAMGGRSPFFQTPNPYRKA